MRKLWYVHTTEDYAAVNGVYTIIICCFKTKKNKKWKFWVKSLIERRGEIARLKEQG